MNCSEKKIAFKIANINEELYLYACLDSIFKIEFYRL